MIEAVRSILDADVQRLLKQQNAAQGDDPEGVHQMRVAARRMRGFLRVLRPLLDKLWVQTLSDEVAWLAGELGSVRDVDVLFEALAEYATQTGSSIPVAIQHELTSRRVAGRDRLKVLFCGARYQALEQTLAEAVRQPQCVEASEQKPAGPALLRRLDKRARLLRRSFRQLSEQTNEGQFHAVRKRAKDLRYSAEAVAPWLGHKNRVRAKRLSKRLSKATDQLGQLQDQVTHIQQLTSLAASVNLSDLPVIQRWLADLNRQRAESLPVIVGKRKRWIRPEDLDWA